MRPSSSARDVSPPEMTAVEWLLKDESCNVMCSLRNKKSRACRSRHFRQMHHCRPFFGQLRWAV
jgi:hypothetical protein